MNKYLPVGNDFVSLPCINELTGGVEDLSFLYMKAKGLIDVRGNNELPLIQPYVQLNNSSNNIITSHKLNWTRLNDWLPQFALEDQQLKINTLYLAPIDERGFAIKISIKNDSDCNLPVVVGLKGCWASSWHCVNEDKELSGKACCFHSVWNNSLIFEYHSTFPLFAFAPMCSSSIESTYEQSNEGAITYNLAHAESIPAHKELSLVFYWGIGFEEVAAATSAKEMLRQTFDADLARTKAWLQERHITFAGDTRLTQLYNTNLFFCMFFSTGITLDTEELVLVTSRSPRYYVSAAYWDRDSLLWSFPAILDVDQERARKMLSYVFSRQRRNFGIHSRYIDGTVLEPGFELDELVAPLLALENYIAKTNDHAILDDYDIIQGIDIILRRLNQHKANACQLYDTFLQPTDDEHVYPYITYDNVLVWKALKDLSQLAPQYEYLSIVANKIKDAIMTYCVQNDVNGKPYFGWSVDLNGNHDVYDEPPGSLQLLPLFDFCSSNDEIYRNTIAMIRSPEYKYSFANSPINETGCPHAPHPWILSLANSLLCGRIEHCRSILEKISMDNGIACESVDEVTGFCTTGEAFATCAGFLCHAIHETLL